MTTARCLQHLGRHAPEAVRGAALFQLLRMFEGQAAAGLGKHNVFTAEHEAALKLVGRAGPALHRAAAMLARACLLRMQHHRQMEAFRLYPKALRLLEGSPPADKDAMMCIGCMNGCKVFVRVSDAQVQIAKQCEREMALEEERGRVDDHADPLADVPGATGETLRECLQATCAADLDMQAHLQAWLAALERVPGGQCDCCGRPATRVALQKCAKCKRAWYCSSSCQQTHWAHHRERCRKAGDFRLGDMVVSDALEDSKCVPWELWEKVVGPGGDVSWVAQRLLHRTLQTVPEAALTLDPRLVGIKVPRQVERERNEASRDSRERAPPAAFVQPAR